MSLNDTPRAERLHIGIFGRRNSGKSSLINALTGQQTAIVSPVAGTTTDPVFKAMEISGLGPVVFIDTAGFDEPAAINQSNSVNGPDDFDKSVGFIEPAGSLGALRLQKTTAALAQTDLALLLISSELLPPNNYSAASKLAPEKKWLDVFNKRKIPCLLVLTKTDLLTAAQLDTTLTTLEKYLGQTAWPLSCRQPDSISAVLPQLARLLPADAGSRTITGNLAAAGDVVLLVMPQDIQAPKGRLILPQVQTLRELLDKKCLPVCCTASDMPRALQSLRQPPALIITDSQVFPAVAALRPAASLLTSFSVLFAAYKGDIAYFVHSAAAIDRLSASSRVLIAEACTHAPLEEDIGRVKIPRLLRRQVGEGLRIDLVSGSDFPADLSCYDLIIHCGSCMFNRRYVLTRVAAARSQHVPMTNYGVAIAQLTGILQQVALP